MSKTPNIKTSWSRIEAWLNKHAPSHAKSLGKPATKKDVDTLIDKIGVKLPKPFVDSCMVHAGDKSECDFIPDGFGTFYLMQLKDIPREWKMLNDLKASGDFNDSEAEPSDGVVNEWWTETWIPFAANGGGDLFCFDIKPPKGGKKWQIIKFIHDDAKRELVALSFAEWLSDVADRIDDGELADLIDA